MSKKHKYNPYKTNSQKQVEQQKELDKREKARRDQELNDIRQILDIKSGAGKRFFRRLITDTHIFFTVFQGNSWTAFLDGERNVGLRYFKDIKFECPGMLPELIDLKEDRYGEPKHKS